MRGDATRRERREKERGTNLLVCFVGVDGVVTGEELHKSRVSLDALEIEGGRENETHDAAKISRPLWSNRHGCSESCVESGRDPCCSIVRR